ncbi:glycoside hydrolase family 13 protein [Sedimentibacter sp.]|uniref:glycoside hydrolase family 13 protein n=1 Tax=Sedimentibacter sp. TaxID=1960295 RepID=UPI0028A6CC85|nr:glycoside hydrolase family 13 protein [Sedimentibacter sp.]
MYIFDNQSEFFRYPQGGIRTNTEITIKIHIKKNASHNPKIIIEKRNNHDKIFYKEIPLSWIGTENSYDLYKGIFAIKEYGHYFYSFIFNENNSSPTYEMLIYTEDYETPKWIKGGIIYHIFIDRFYREKLLNKNTKRKIIIRNDWGGIPNYIPDENEKINNNDFFGGNIEGIIKKLPYLNELGVTAIYLSPIFEAYSNHKYDIGDYLKIDPMFGDEAALSQLCKEAGKYGMGVILDGVFSHTGDDSIYFNKYGSYNSIGAYQSKLSRYYDWYTFNKWNDDYVSWWGIKTLPEVNEENEIYIDFITGENGVIKHWQNVGIKGWRLDVADELPDNFLNILRNSVKSHNPDSFIVGEVWEDAANKFSYNKLKEYFCGNQLDSVTNYPLKDALIHYVKNKDCGALYETMNSIVEKYPPQAVNGLMNIIGTHDTERILTVLGSEARPKSKEERAKYKLNNKEIKKGIELLKIASLLQFTLPGVPCIYYGDEAGAEGFEDPFNRLCYPWGNENLGILNHYKFLSSLRKNNLFKDGKYKCIIHDREVFAFERYNQKNRVIIAVNLSNETITLKFKENMKEYKKGITNNNFLINQENYLILFS